MRIAGEHEFVASPAQIWAALHDPAVLARALPGARRVEPTGPDAYAITVDVGVGSVKGTYEGMFALTDQHEPSECTVTARATGRPGSVETTATMRLSDRAGGGALLAYEADANVTGPLAGVGQRLIAGAARRTTERFLAALDTAVLTSGEAVGTAGETVGAAAGPTATGRAIVGASRARPDARVIVASALAGAAAALLGVAVGRWTGRR